MDGNQQNHSGFILCGRYMICMLSVCGGQMKIAFPESTAAALLKTGLHFWVGPKVKRFSPRDHLTALIWGRGWASLADCSGGSSKQRGMDGLPRGRRKERWPSPPGARCPQGRPSGSREGGGGPRSVVGVRSENAGPGAPSARAQDPALPTVKVTTRTGGTCGGLAQPKGTGRSWERREAAAAGASSSGSGVGEAGRRGAGRRPSGRENGGGGSGGSGPASHVRQPHAGAHSSPALAPPRASCAAPGAVLERPSSSEHSAHPGGRTSWWAAGAWAAGKLGLPLAELRSGARR